MGWMQGTVRWLRKAWEILHTPVPAWVRELVTKIGQILVDILGTVAQTYVTSIERKIMEMSKTNYDNSEKFNAVWNFSKELLPALKESELDTLVQNLFIKLKKSGVIK